MLYLSTLLFLHKRTKAVGSAGAHVDPVWIKLFEVIDGRIATVSIDVRRPIAVDLFAGAGGLSLGLEQAGYEVAASVEFDPIHAAVHEFNFPYGKTFCVDARTISGEEIRAQSAIGDQEVHLVAGGPPCQGISLMGKRVIDDTRNELLKEFVRLVIEIKPRYFLMENVAGLMVGKHKQLLDEVIHLFEKSGEYRIVKPVKVLQAADYGTPQSRKRLILLGNRKDVPPPSYPVPSFTPRLINGLLPTSTTLPLGTSVIEALGDLPDADNFEDLLHTDSVYTKAFGTATAYSARLRGLEADSNDYSHPRPHNIDELTSSARTIHTARSIERFSNTPCGTTEKVSRFLRLHPEGICNTLRAGTASDHGAYTAPRPIHPIYARVITVREAARLHGYPDWFRFHVTKWNGFREIGNSVPALLGRAVASEILRADQITPLRPEAVPLGNTALLSMTSGEAHKYFGLMERVIAQREQRLK